MRRLDLLVPHFDETPDEMEPLLDSLKLQRSIDLTEVGVIIAYDGPDATELPLDEWRARYPFTIEDVHPEKGGVSHTRNAALDASTAEYVTFVDADDCFEDICGLSIVFREMDISADPRDLVMNGVDPKDNEPGFDFLIANFREESRNPKTGEIVYIDHPMDGTFVHSKTARRQWLVDNDLRFDDDICYHEDSYWVLLCREVAKPWRARYCPHAYFLWCWRSRSCCRRDELYIQKTFSSLLLSNSRLVDQLVKRMMPESANRYVGQMIYEAYYTLCKPEWLSETNAEYREKVERDFVDYYHRHSDKWMTLTSQERTLISQGVRQRSVMEGMLMEPITLNQWLSEILEKYPEE